MQTQPRSDEAAAGEKPALTNPSLTANLRGDYAALQNDFEQASVLAADFQRQLAGKSNEVAHLKQVFEKTARDLAHLQEGITALREERHRLANEAMRAIALDHRLKRAEAENEHLMAEAEKSSRREHERESQIAQLTGEVEKLTQQLVAAQGIQTAPRIENAEAQALVATAADALERLGEIVNAKGAAPQKRTAATRAGTNEAFIDISFEP